MLKLLYSYQWIFIVIILINFIIFVYVLGPRFEKGHYFDTFTKFLTYLTYLLSIIGFIYGIYLCYTLIPTVGEYSGSTTIRSAKGNIYRFLIPLLVTGFNSYLLYAIYPVIKDYLKIK